MGNTWLQFGIIVVLTLLNGFFAASEIAVVSSRRGRLQQRAATGSRGAQIALELADEPNRFLATVQVGITLIGVVAAAFGGDVLADPIAQLIRPYVGAASADAVAFVLVVVLITYLSLILGELVPKRLALQNAEAMAVFVAPIMRLVSRLAAPIVWFLTSSTQLVLRVLGRTNVTEEQVTEEDVLSLVREGSEEGTVAAGERELIERVFNFSDVTTRTIMTPRTEIVAIAVDTPLPEVVARVIATGYSRIPIFRGSLDTIEGILYAKELLRLSQLKAEATAHVALIDFIRPPAFVLEHQRLGSVLQQFRQNRTHLALVLDEYGQVDGLVTLEDVLEELTGDIADEYDEADTMVVQRSDGSYLVDGLLSYPDAEQRIGLPPRGELSDLPSFDTVAGLILALLEHIPTTGESATFGDWQFEVIDMDGMRIDKVLVQRTAAATASEQTNGALALGAVLPAPQVTQPQSSSNTNEQA